MRGNLGGNVWPMTVGVGALLGEGWQSYEIDRDGKRSPYVRLEQGAAVIVSGEQAGLTIIAPDAWQPLPALAEVPVAMLIDDAVASSGEGMAVAFRGRANTRFFGQRTYGSASSNEGFVLDDRVNIVVTTAMMSDRTGAIYPDGVPPDDEVAFGPGDAADPDDAVVEAAKAWLGAQPACR
jgi:C-terminal processing protease CtpA/Prc